MIPCESYYPFLLSSLPVGYLFSTIQATDSDSYEINFIEANEAFENLTGFSFDQLNGKHKDVIIQRFFMKKPEFIEKIRKVASGGENECFEYFSTTLKKWYKIFLYSPEKHYLTVILLDITHQKQSEKALIRSEKRYMTLFDNAGDAIFIMKDDLFIECNKKTLSIFGCEKEDILFQTPVFFSPEYQPDGISSIEKAKMKINAAQKGEPQYFEWVHKKLDGTLFYTEVSLNTTEIMGDFLIQAIVRDIDRRKKSEELLKQSEEKYRRLYKTMVDAFACVDMTGRLIEYNSIFKEMLGYSDEELSNISFQDLTPAKWHDFEKKIIEEQIIPRGFSDTYRKEYIKKDGTVFSVELRTSLLSDKSGKPEAMWAIIRDISNR